MLSGRFYARFPLPYLLWSGRFEVGTGDGRNFPLPWQEPPLMLLTTPEVPEDFALLLAESHLTSGEQVQICVWIGLGVRYVHVQV